MVDAKKVGRFARHVVRTPIRTVVGPVSSAAVNSATWVADRGGVGYVFSKLSPGKQAAYNRILSTARDAVSNPNSATSKTLDGLVAGGLALGGVIAVGSGLDMKEFGENVGNVVGHVTDRWGFYTGAAVAAGSAIYAASKVVRDKLGRTPYTAGQIRKTVYSGVAGSLALLVGIFTPHPYGLQSRDGEPVAQNGQPSAPANQEQLDALSKQVKELTELVRQGGVLPSPVPTAPTQPTTPAASGDGYISNAGIARLIRDDPDFVRATFHTDPSRLLKYFDGQPPSAQNPEVVGGVYWTANGAFGDVSTGGSASRSYPFALTRNDFDAVSARLTPAERSR